MPMKKKSYRAVPVNQINCEALRERLAGKALIVGVDAAKTSFVATLMDDEHQTLVTVKWQHPHQSRELVALLLATGACKVEAALEPTGSYGASLLHLLRRSGIGVFRVSAKRVHDAAEVFDGVPSQHDAKCAAIIAKLHADGLSTVWMERSESERDIAASVKTMDRAKRIRMSLLNELESSVAQYWPELDTLMDLDRTAVLSLLGEYGSPAEVAEHAAEARALMRRVGGYRMLPQKVEDVLRAAAQTLGVPMTAGEEEALRELCRQLLATKRQVRDAEKNVVAQASSSESATHMAALVGNVTAVVLMSEAGDPRLFASTSAYVKTLGLNLKERSSGRKKGALSITKRGSGMARRYLFLAAWRQVQKDPITRAWYEAKIERDGGKVRMRALIAVMRKLARALWHVARGNPYDAAKLFDVRRLGDRLAAA